MSVVWRGYDELLGRLVAIKVLSRKSADAELFSGRMRQEAMASARITHPNIAGVYDYGEIAESGGPRVPYMVMELVEGRSLANRLAEGPMPWREAVRVCAEVAAALLAAHEAGLVHRDISPANVLLTPGGAKVIDFGISAPIGEQESKSMRLGTPAFIAPERFGKGGIVHPATDVYALGVLLYQAASGALPWPADSISQLLSQQRYVAPAPLPPVPDLPPVVARLIERCLSRQPEQRPSSQDVALTLAEVANIRIAPRVPNEPPGPGPERPMAATRMLAVGQRPAPGRTGRRPASSPSRPLLTGGHGSRDAGMPPMPLTVRPGMARSRKVALIGLSSVMLMAGGATMEVASSGAGAAPAKQVAAPGSAPGSPSASGPPPSVAASGSGSGCAVTYHVRSMWDGGFSADVRLTNTGNADLSTWTLTFALRGNQHVLQGWNGVFGQTGQDVTVLDTGFNSKLHAGGTTTVGFNGSYQQSNPPPEEFRLNGLRCSLQTE